MNLLKMYSNQLFIIVIFILLFPNFFPEKITDVVKASCVILAIIFSFIIIYYGYNKIIKLHKTYLPDIPNFLYPIIIFIVHYLTIFLIGMPKYNISYLYASIIMFIWFKLNNVSEIYNL